MGARMNQISQLKDQFLISMPNLANDYFSGSLIYLCEHSQEGAMGLVVNKPAEATLAEVFEQLELHPIAGLLETVPVFAGGPVKIDRGFILHSPSQTRWKSSVVLREGLQLTTSLDVLEELAQGKGPERYLMTLGYAGWGPGQLEEEIAQNLWLSCPANLDILFNTEPDQRLNAAALQFGIDINLVSSQVGHA